MRAPKSVVPFTAHPALVIAAAAVAAGSLAVPADAAQAAVPVSKAGVRTLASTAARPPAKPRTGYNGMTALAYANRWVQNGKGKEAYNPAYPAYDTDCTNFVSQALWAGGLPASTRWKPGSTAFVRSTALLAELKRRGYAVTVIKGHALYRNQTGAKPGDVYFFDWGVGRGVTHAALASTVGRQVHLNAIGQLRIDGWGSRIVQHSYDRKDAPWNLGVTSNQPDVNPRGVIAYLVHVA